MDTQNSLLHYERNDSQLLVVRSDNIENEAYIFGLIFDVM